jgi:hypothetical protein
MSTTTGRRRRRSLSFRRRRRARFRREEQENVLRVMAYEAAHAEARVRHVKLDVVTLDEE